MNVFQMEVKEFFYRASLVISFICNVFFSIIWPFVIGLTDNGIEIFRPTKVYIVVGLYFINYLGFYNSIGMRYLTPQNTFWILPYSKTWAIGYLIKCILKWKITIFTILLFVVPELFLPISLKDKLIDIAMFLMLLFSFIVLYAVMWHTQYDKKRIKDYNLMMMIPTAFLLYISGAVSNYFSLWDFFAGLAVFCLFEATFLYIRRYKFCK